MTRTRYVPFMKEFDINNYKHLLKQVCDSCKKYPKCNKKDEICLRKKLVWSISKHVYKQRKKNKELKEDECC